MARKKVELESRARLVFVGGTDIDDYVCPICYDVAYKSPQKLGCPCKAILCKKCIEDLIENHRRPGVPPCPVCRNEEWTCPQDVAQNVKSEIDCLKVYCPNKSEGCSETFQLRAAANHITECLLQNVTCPCGTDVKRRDSEDHKQHYCPLRIVSCPVCHVLVSFRKLDSHRNIECRKMRVNCTNNECTVTVQRGKMCSHLKRCPYRIVDCSDCGESLTYKALSDHATSACPKRIVTCSWCNLEGESELVNGSQHRDIDCPFVPCPNGCKGGGQIMKRDLSDKHLDHCPKQTIECKYIGICSKTMPRDEEAIHYLLEMEEHLRKLYFKFLDEQKKIKHLTEMLLDRNGDKKKIAKQIKSLDTKFEVKLSAHVASVKELLTNHSQDIMAKDLEIKFSRELASVTRNVSRRHDELIEEQHMLQQQLHSRFDYFKQKFRQESECYHVNQIVQLQKVEKKCQLLNDRFYYLMLAALVWPWVEDPFTRSMILIYFFYLIINFIVM